ncbi:MAG: DUF2256 domain-containing protein [Verrucomicrobia bacterium]|nr:MAG: DUF2256 domain-containing protein [Verrucomicrobiota bacterium]
MQGVKKQNLPQKPCAHCKRMMVWRKKWQNVWNEVRYCSDRCRKSASSAK